MPSDRRHNRSLNMRDEIWDWLHRAYLAAGSASLEREAKSDYVERVIAEGIRAVARSRGVSDCYRPPVVDSAPDAAPATPPPPPPAHTPPSPVRRPPAAVATPRLTAEERRQQRAARLLQQTAPTLHPPTIQTAASRPPDDASAAR
jgi:hypothetical protein